MREGGEAALCVLASCEAPEREGDGLTSMGAGVVLSSTAVRLGEHGTVHELAEGELFRWAYASEFDALRFTHPIALSAERCMVHLRLTNARVGMEQLVFYTALGGGLARGQAVAHLCRKGGSVAGVRHGRGRAGSGVRESRAQARIKYNLRCKLIKTGDMRLGFYTSGGRKFPNGNFRTSVFCEVKTHLVGKTSVFRQIKQKPFRFLGRVNGACGRTRTGDLRITNALLYQLSHASSYCR